jgi:hypothetical protein
MSENTVLEKRQLTELLNSMIIEKNRLPDFQKEYSSSTADTEKEILKQSILQTVDLIIDFYNRMIDIIKNNELLQLYFRRNLKYDNTDYENEIFNKIFDTITKLNYQTHKIEYDANSTLFDQMFHIIKQIYSIKKETISLKNHIFLVVDHQNKNIEYMKKVKKLDEQVSHYSPKML